jgi:DNA replication initiation complex subunit (GINS family)
MNTLQAKENIVKCFDSEVDSLNSNIAALKRELLRCRSNINSQGCCHHEKTSSMFEDISSLTLELEMAKQENILLTLFSKDLVTENENVALELHESKEKLAVAEISSALNESARPQLLGQVQTLWKELGISSTEREQLRNQIETCLKGTCYKLLDDAEKRKDKIQSEISSLREYICRICSSLELKTPTFPSSEKPLLHQLDIILHHKSHLTPVLQSAMKRRQAIVSSVFDLTYALDIPQSLLDENLRTLIAEDSETSVLSTISESFLSKCDEAVAELQIEKSKILSKNAVLHGEAVSMIEEMGLDGKDVISLVSHAVNRKMPLPKWWEDQTLEMVSRSVSSIGGLVRTSRQFSLHLEIVHDTMQKIAAVRSLLTKKLRSIVERTQRMLLKTVDGEFGTESELSIFQKELCGFSPLSREFICACFVEIESLCNEVGVMTQSEIEALTVVSEALNISSSNRGMFWDAIDQSLREIRGQNISPFDDALALSAADGEEWLLLEMKNGTKSYVELEARLFKLQKIHAEVEQLRDRQDSKSKIMSLDAQVRILNAQIQDFEGGKSNKQRLISKTAAGFSLLQEERFRKQIQLKLSFTLRQLISMLKAWKGNESSLFDEELLSDDVKNILKNSDRIEFLHLRTVENKSSLKRPADANQTVSDIHLLPNKRSKFCNCDTIIELPSRDITRMRIGGEQKNKRVLSPAPSINQKKCLQAETKNDKSRNDASSNLLTYATGKKRPVLDPFGNVLAHAISPRPPSNNKENP